MAGIGHNSSSSLEAAADANVQTGVLLLCKEALVTAIQDRRLERGHLRVLAAMVSFVNVRAKAWPGRLQLALMTGLSAKTISNILLELRTLGYLIAEREIVPESGNRKMTVYTLGNVDHETIRRQITDWVMSLRETGGKSPPTGNSEVPAHGESPRPRGTATSPPTGNSAEEVPVGGEKRPEKSPPAGDSNKKESICADKPEPEADTTKAKRGSRLPETWELPPELRQWTLDNFRVDPDIVSFEADKFRDYWHGVSGQRGAKLDWGATWRNWARTAFSKKVRPRLPLSLSPQGPAEDLTAAYARLREQEEGEC